MAIKGSLREASLPDVLQLLAMGGKTGCLAVTDRAQLGYIFFQGGRISYASIVNRRDRLGDLFVKNGVITYEQLALALDEQVRTPARRIGEILVSHGAITREQLEQHVRMQVEDAVYHLFTWTQGSFFFEADVEPEDRALCMSINPENLLLEGARRVDEWSLIEKKIPSLEMIFAVDPERSLPDDLVLSDLQRRVLPLLDGDHSVWDIVEELALTEFDAGTALFGLIQAGIASAVGRRPRTPAAGSGTARVAEHRNLGIAFYHCGMHEEATREFRRVVELQPDNLEARFILALIDLRRGDARSAAQQFRALLERSGPRYEPLLNLALTFERVGRLENARVAVEEALRVAPENPAVLLSHAVILLKLRRVGEAVAAFGRYRRTLPAGSHPPAAYFVFSVVAEASAGRIDVALQLGEEGISRYPHSAPLLLHLGAVRERRGDWDAAELMYRRATEEDPSLPQAHKALGDALYRRGAHFEAADALRYAVQLAPDLGDDVYFKLGNIAYKRADRKEAVRLWQRALTLNPDNAVVRTNLEVVESVLGEGMGVPTAGAEAEHDEWAAPLATAGRHG